MNTIYNISDNVSFESGGVRTVVLSLNEYLASETNFNSKIITNQKEINDDFVEFKSSLPWKYSPDYNRYINKNITIHDKIHIHGVFMYTQYYASSFAINKNIPNLITPHGMLEPWHLNDKKLKKDIYLKFFLNTMLKKASYLHCITPLEKENLFNLTHKKNIFEIPNLLQFNTIPKNLNYNSQEDYFLFVGRIHPKKGLDILIEAMSKIENKTIRLKILGSENQYSIFLKEKYKKTTAYNRIDFVGGVFGDEKFSYYANAKAFVAPSYSEAIGLVNLEAAACKTPVITSYNTGISPLWNKEGGIMINPNLAELTNALNEASNWNDNEKNDRGSKLCEFVFNNYSWEKKGFLWNELYTLM